MWCDATCLDQLIWCGITCCASDCSSILLDVQQLTARMGIQPANCHRTR